MATATIAAIPDSPTIPPESLYQLSVEQYHQMADAGILTTGDRVELVEGVLVRRMTISPLHTFVTQQFTDLIDELVKAGMLDSNSLLRWAIVSQNQTGRWFADGVGTIENSIRSLLTSASCSRPPIAR